MGGGNGTRNILAIIRDPSRPQPIGNVQRRGILSRHYGCAFACDTAEDGIDQRFEVDGFIVRLCQAIGGIHRGMGRDIQKQKLARARDQYLERGTGLVRLRRLGNEDTDQGFQMAENGAM